ncbi:MAG: hypothetical protein WDW38_009634 [Sanguina aurantia]
MYYAFDSPPLVVPEPVFCQPGFTAKLFLDEALSETTTVQQLLTLCMVADALIERVHRVENSGSSFDLSILQKIEAACGMLAPRKSAQAALQSLGLLDMFPYLQMGLAGKPLQDVSQHHGTSYLAYITQLNQVVMLGSQLYYDACVPEHHKYVAHQVALLYHTLNLLQSDTKVIRRLVEARFDEIKTITESKDPYMSIEMSDWLQGITWLCREEVRLCPGYIHRRLDPVVQLARC